MESSFFPTSENETRFWNKLLNADIKELKRLEDYLDREYEKEEVYLNRICEPQTKTIILQKVHGLSSKEIKKVDLDSVEIKKDHNNEQYIDYKRV